MDRDRKQEGEMKKTISSGPRRTGLIIWMIVAQVLTVASLSFWLLVAGLSFMAFDGGNTSEAWTTVILIWSYPLFPIIASIIAWVAFAKRKNILAGIFAGVAFAPPVLLILIIFIANTSWFVLNGR